MVAKVKVEHSVQLCVLEVKIFQLATYQGPRSFYLRIIHVQRHNFVPESEGGQFRSVGRGLRGLQPPPPPPKKKKEREEIGKRKRKKEERKKDSKEKGS